MSRKLFCLTAVFLPVCLLWAQQPNSQATQPPPNAQATQPPPNAQAPQQSQNLSGFHQPSHEAMRHIFDERQRMKERSIAINDLAGHIQSPDDARKLVDLVAAEFSDEMPPRWATRGIRERIARAEYAAAAEGALISDERVAAVWNDFLEKIGAPQEDMLNAAEIHYVRDAQYTSARIMWNSYDKNLWSIPGVFAVGQDGKVAANGSRALEAIRLLWNLGNETEDFSGIHAQVQKGVLVSDLYAQAQKQQSSGREQRSVSGFAVARIVSYPVQQAAFRYVREHGEGAFNRAVEGLLKDLVQ